MVLAQLVVVFAAAWVGFRIAARKKVSNEPASANA